LRENNKKILICFLANLQLIAKTYKKDGTKLENCEAKNPEKLVSSSLIQLVFAFLFSQKLLIGFRPNSFLSFLSLP
jgi:hypothetical protein